MPAIQVDDLLPNDAIVLDVKPHTTLRDAVIILAKFRDEYVTWSCNANDPSSTEGGRYHGDNLHKAKLSFHLR